VVLMWKGRENLAEWGSSQEGWEKPPNN